MAHWKRRRPANTQSVAAPPDAATTGQRDGLRQQLAEREEEIVFLRAQLSHALAGWREAQQRLTALEAHDEPDQD